MEPINEHGIYELMNDILSMLREVKPDNRSDLDRRYAITITDMEKVMMYFKMFVIDASEVDKTSAILSR